MFTFLESCVLDSMVLILYSIFIKTVAVYRTVPPQDGSPPVTDSDEVGRIIPNPPWNARVLPRDR